MIRLLLMLATALGVVWLLDRVDTEELRADPVGAIVGQLRIVSPLAPAPKPAGNAGSWAGNCVRCKSKCTAWGSEARLRAAGRRGTIRCTASQ